MGLFGSRNKKAPEEPVGKVTLSNGQTYEIAARVDCLGDNCPRPQLMTRKALQAAASDDVIEVLVDNPSSMEAIPPMMPGLNATHLETVKGNRRWEIYVRKD